MSTPDGGPGLLARSAILCDDIRREHNGKLTFVGVYVGAVVLPRKPSNFKICLWLEAQGLRPASSLEIKTTVASTDPEDKSETVKKIAQYKSKVGETFGVVLERMPVRALGPGYISVQARLDDGDWVEFAHKQIIIKPAPSVSSEPQPPSGQSQPVA